MFPFIRADGDVKSIHVSNTSVVPIGAKTTTPQYYDVSEESVVCVHLCFDSHYLERQVKDVICADFSVAAVKSESINFTHQTEESEINAAILNMFQERYNMIVFSSDQLLVGSQFLRSRSSNVVINQHLNFSVKESNKIFRLYTLYPVKDEESPHYILSLCFEIFRNDDCTYSARGAKEAGVLILEIDESQHMFSRTIARFSDNRYFSFTNTAVDLDRALIDISFDGYECVIGTYLHPYDDKAKHYRELTFDHRIHIAVRNVIPGIYHTYHSVSTDTHNAGAAYSLLTGMFNETAVSLRTHGIYHRPTYDQLFNGEVQVNRRIEQHENANKDTKAQKLSEKGMRDIVSKKYASLTDIQKQHFRFYIRFDEAFIDTIKAKRLLLENMSIEEIHNGFAAACRPSTTTDKKVRKTHCSSSLYAKLYYDAIENLHADRAAVYVFSCIESAFLKYASQYLLLAYRSKIDSEMGRSYWSSVSHLPISNKCVRHHLFKTTAAINNKLKDKSCIMYNIIIYYSNIDNEVHTVLSNAKGCRFKFRKHNDKDISVQNVVACKFIFVPIRKSQCAVCNILDCFYKGTVNIFYVSSSQVQELITEIKSTRDVYMKDNIYTAVKRHKTTMDDKLVELMNIVNFDCAKPVAAYIVNEFNIYSIMIANYVYDEVQIKGECDVGVCLYCLDGLIPKHKKQYFMAGGFIDHKLLVDYGGFSIFDELKSGEYISAHRRPEDYVHIRLCTTCCVTI